MIERNVYPKYLNNNRGTSLIETIIAITILTIVICPFLGIFLSTTYTNSDSLNVINSSTLAQKAMEEIKSNPGFLASHCDAGLGVYEENGNVTTKYNISKVSESNETEENSSFENINNTNFDLFFDIQKLNVQILSDGYPLSGKYLLEIYGSSSTYYYRLKDEGNVVLKTGTIDSTTDPIRLKFQVSSVRISEDADLNISINLDSLDANKNVYAYIVDDNDTDSSIVLKNIGTRPFSIYSLVSSNFKVYSNVLYKVEVTAYVGKQENSKLVSYVKK